MRRSHRYLLIHGLATALIAGLSIIQAGYARAATSSGLNLPAECATIQVDSLHAAPSGRPAFDATKFTVRLPASGNQPAAPMQAANLHVSTDDAATSEAQLERAASASAAALLIALTGNGHGSCPTEQLEDAGKPIVAGLERGGSYQALWKSVVLRGGAGVVTIARMQLALQAGPLPATEERPVHVTLSLEGVAGKLKPPTLLPDHIKISVTLPAASLPTLLAATGGGAPDAQIPVTVDNITITHGPTVLHGTGDAIAAATPMQSTTNLHMVARNFSDLMQDAADAGLDRLHTALLLTGLMGKRSADGSALSWDIKLADQALAVNDVPIPLR